MSYPYGVTLLFTIYNRNNNKSHSKSSQTQQLFILVLFQQHVSA